MSNCPRRGSGPRPPWPRPARAAAVITVMAAAALLAAACGGSPSSTGSGGSPNAGGSTNSPSAVAWIQCVRSHGVPGFPGPDSSGQIPKITSGQQVGVSDSRLNAAQGACQDLWPYQAPPTLTGQERQDYLKTAACMRSHGITNFPDPTFPGGRVSFSIPSSIDTTSRLFTQARQTCTRLIPAGLPYSSGSGGGS
jgi:hypothetical protein